MSPQVHGACSVSVTCGPCFAIAALDSPSWMTDAAPLALFLQRNKGQEGELSLAGERATV